MGVAFLTLFERQFLGGAQLRVGPQKVGWGGLLQPFADAIKLLGKSEVGLGIKTAYLVGPGAILSSILMSWWVLRFDWSWGGVYFVCVLSVGVYGLFLCGWGRNSKYALLGAVRGVAQTISYEVCFMFILLSVFYVRHRFCVSGLWVGGVLWPLVILWVISCLAEANRAPFDFAEGESELVSGFNVEFGGSGFMLIFLGEYMRIVFLSCISRVIWLGWMGWGGFLVFFFVWGRASFPRERYDRLMYLM